MDEIKDLISTIKDIKDINFNPEKRFAELEPGFYYKRSKVTVNVGICPYNIINEWFYLYLYNGQKTFLGSYISLKNSKYVYDVDAFKKGNNTENFYLYQRISKEEYEEIKLIATTHK